MTKPLRTEVTFDLYLFERQDQMAASFNNKFHNELDARMALGRLEAHYPWGGYVQRTTRELLAYTPMKGTN